MLAKLALRNVRRSAKDYLVYFVTMTVVAALMFAFNSLLFSADIQEMFHEAQIMEIMLGLATFFIVLIVAWLINYMLRFILEKRSREFGIYLLLGMEKRQIAKLYMRENILLGAGAFLAGLVFGILVQQLLMSILYSMVLMDYRLNIEINRACLAMTILCYAGCYLLALLRCRRKLRKMNIHSLMNAERRNEEIKESHEGIKRWLLPLSVLFLSLSGVWLFCWKEWDSGVM
ncbi:MAG: ABC transporter permease, partial [Lachnospiraceae bacterium]|nr:ABC transporter permease [Lachnospiraceae bacterium]